LNSQPYSAKLTSILPVFGNVYLVDIAPACCFSYWNDCWLLQ